MPNVSFIQYAARTGRPLCRLSLPDRESDFDMHNALLIPDQDVNLDEVYIVGGIVTPRPSQPCSIDKTEIAATGEDATTISGIPDGSVVSVSGPASFDPAVVSGGSLDFAASVPGEYILRLELFPFLPWEVVIHAS